MEYPAPRPALTGEVEIATNVKLNPLYLIDRKDEIEYLKWPYILKYLLMYR